MAPLLTILTATRNVAGELPFLLDSLAVQTCRDFEVIIQDGGSSDGTPAVAESYRDRLPRLVLTSEKDAGLYDAWNRALLKVSGEWILFLGADDELFSPKTLERCHAILRDLPPEALYAGGGIDKVGRDRLFVRHDTYVPAADRRDLCSCMLFPHSSLWHRRTLFANACFDTSLRIVGDYDFVCRTWTPENGRTVIPFTITRMRRGGLSDQPQSKFQLRWENARVASRYFPGVWTFRRCRSLLTAFFPSLLARVFGCWGRSARPQTPAAGD